ncbi:MAG: TRAP transporter substrate-binding protein DctP [Desulfobacterales bacterium]|nr:TRAP transporter substrate-binding protein DctP [Desulfobacterales bacterium]
MVSRRTMKMATLGIGLCLSLVLVISLVSSIAAPIEIKAITFLPRAHKTAQPAQGFTDRMNAAAGGKLVIKYLGGPEVIPGRDQPEALRSGAVDIFFGPAAWAAAAFNFREAQVLMNSSYSPVEEREKGVYEQFLELSKKRGLYYLGRFDWREEYFMWTTFPVSKPEDLKGRKLYVPMSFVEVYKALNIVGVTFPTQELYTAMERGTVEGTTLPLPPIRSFGIHELVKYCIDHPMHSSGLVGFMSLKKWESLPKELQDLVAGTYAKWEREELMPGYEKLYDVERKALQDKGIKFVKFSDEGKKEFMRAVEEESWKALAKKMGDENQLDRLRKLVGK